MRRPVALGLSLVLVASVFPLVTALPAAAQTEQTPAAIPARHVEPVIRKSVV